MEEYLIKDGKKMRLGYTTGSCAAAAAKAAAWMLVSGRVKETISLVTPKGIALELAVEEIERTEDAVRCAIRKDSGDDPDVTNGSLVYATVTRIDSPDILIDGGEGVGRVTKPGLDQPVGNAAINSIPRQMIRENLEEVRSVLDVQGGFSVVISIPAGVELAKKTFNPRLGIVGGISVLGTTGIVEPMSEKALVDTIRVELKQRRASGAEVVLLTPGNYGFDYIQANIQVNPKVAVLTSNFIGDTIDICRELGFQGALLVGHIGKLVKIAGNVLNTHSKYGDCRMEIMAAHSAAAGLPAEAVQEMLDCVACDEGLHILERYGLMEPALARITDRIGFNLTHRAGEDLELGAILFSKDYGFLSETPNARALLNKITED